MDTKRGLPLMVGPLRKHALGVELLGARISKNGQERLHIVCTEYSSLPAMC